MSIPLDMHRRGSGHPSALDSGLQCLCRGQTALRLSLRQNSFRYSVDVLDEQRQ